MESYDVDGFARRQNRPTSKVKSAEKKEIETVLIISSDDDDDDDVMIVGEYKVESIQDTSERELVDLCAQRREILTEIAKLEPDSDTDSVENVDTLISDQNTHDRANISIGTFTSHSKCVSPLRDDVQRASTSPESGIVVNDDYYSSDDYSLDLKLPSMDRPQSLKENRRVSLRRQEVTNTTSTPSPAMPPPFNHNSAVQQLNTSFLNSVSMPSTSANATQTLNATPQTNSTTSNGRPLNANEISEIKKCLSDVSPSILTVLVDAFLENSSLTPNSTPTSTPSSTRSSTRNSTRSSSPSPTLSPISSSDSESDGSSEHHVQPKPLKRKRPAELDRIKQKPGPKRSKTGNSAILSKAKADGTKSSGNDSTDPTYKPSKDELIHSDITSSESEAEDGEIVESQSESILEDGNYTESESDNESVEYMDTQSVTNDDSSSDESPDLKATNEIDNFSSRSSDIEVEEQQLPTPATVTQQNDNDDDDDGNLLFPISTIKNVDKMLYVPSDQAQICRLCSKRYKAMVFHLKTQHPDSEVFVSRVSPQMAEKLSLDSRQFTKTTINYLMKLKTVCIFCDKEKDFQLNYWVEHIRGHTGEYENECQMCKKMCNSKQHCDYPTEKKGQIDLKHDDFLMYRCNECNFIQINFENMETHLRTQHEFSDINDYYTPFIFIPAIDKLATISAEEMQFLAETTAPIDCGPSNGIQILDDIVICPANPANHPIPPMVEIPMEVETSNVAENDANSNDLNRIDRLLKVADEYEQPNSLTKLVRPWIYGDYTRKLGINLHTQYSLYKCMHTKCLFATNSDESWQLHMKEHQTLIDVILNSDKTISSHQLDELEQYRMCSYCVYETSDYHQFISHMNEEHRRDNFQCALCFYRCVEIDNMVFHYENHHSDSSTQHFLVISEQRRFEPKDEEILSRNCHQFIKKIKCGQGDCKKEFTCFDNLFSHILNHSYPLYKCPVSDCLVEMECCENTIREHCLKHNNTLQCVYCVEGFNDINRIREHMADEHPSNFLFIASRWNSTAHGKHDEAQMVYIDKNVKYSEFELTKCLNPDVLNNLNATELHPEDIFQQQTVINSEWLTEETVDPNTIPSISFAGTPNFQKKFLTYEEYEKRLAQRVPCSSTSMDQSASSSHTTSIHNECSLINTDSASSSNKSVLVNTTTVSTHSEIISTDDDYTSPSHCAEVPPNDPSTSSDHTTYMCIDIKLADELIKTINLNYRGRMCYICFDFIQIKADMGTKPIIEHWMVKHSNDMHCKLTKCKHPTVMTNPTEMTEHRMKCHRDEPMVYLQIETTETNWVYKLVRSKWECQICKKRFDTRKEIDAHNFKHHFNTFLDADVVLQHTIVDSNDTKELGQYSESKVFVYRSLFKCRRHKTESDLNETNKKSKIIGTKEEAIAHHNECHSRESFETHLTKLLFSIGTRENETPNSNPEFRAYLVECLYCLKLFESPEKCIDHLCANSATVPTMGPRFMLRKMVACSLHAIMPVRTFNGMTSHFRSDHPTRHCTPVNPFYPDHCGLCNYAYDNENDLIGHYRSEHRNGEQFTDEIMNLFDAQDVTLGQCKFRAGCCTEMDQKTLPQIIIHVSSCARRFSCRKCPQKVFQNKFNFEAHLQREHNKTPEQIIDMLYSPKDFLALLSNMLITMPSGFSFTMDQISNTTFYQQTLRPAVNKKISDTLNKEKQWLNIGQ